MPIGQMELIVILLLVVILFGARKIPELARSVGKAKLEYKKGMEEAEGGEGKEAAEAKREEAPAKPESKPKGE